MEHRCRKCGARTWRELVVEDLITSGVCVECGDAQSWRTVTRFATAVEDERFFEGARFTEVDFSGQDLRGTRWSKTATNNCSFKGAKLNDAILTDAYFNACDFTDADFSCDPPRIDHNVKMKSCTLHGANWKGRDRSFFEMVLSVIEPPKAPAAPVPDALLAAILANPKAIEPRRAWAAQLAATAPMLAEFVRVQLQKREKHRAGQSTEAEDRQSFLILAEGGRKRAWAKGLAPFDEKVEYGGGLPEAITGDAQSVSTHLARLLGVAPLRSLTLTDAHGRLGSLAAQPAFAQIEFLDLHGEDIVDHDLITLVASPHAVNLVSIRLHSATITDAVYEALAKLPKLKHVYADFTTAPLRTPFEDWGGPTTYQANALTSHLYNTVGDRPWLDPDAPVPSLDDL